MASVAVKEWKKEKVDEIMSRLAQVYAKRSGLWQNVAKSLGKLNCQELDDLKTIVRSTGLQKVRD